MLISLSASLQSNEKRTEEDMREGREGNMKMSLGKADISGRPYLRRRTSEKAGCAATCRLLTLLPGLLPVNSCMLAMKML